MRPNGRVRPSEAKTDRSRPRHGRGRGMASTSSSTRAGVYPPVYPPRVHLRVHPHPRACRYQCSRLRQYRPSRHEGPARPRTIPQTRSTTSSSVWYRRRLVSGLVSVCTQNINQGEPPVLAHGCTWPRRGQAETRPCYQFPIRLSKARPRPEAEAGPDSVDLGPRPRPTSSSVLGQPRPRSTSSSVKLTSDSVDLGLS